MNILILHPNFPAQYVYLAPFLASDSNNRVVALANSANYSVYNKGVRVVRYKVLREAARETHIYSKTMEEAILDGQAVFRAVRELGYQGFVPDVVIGHTGWGSTLFLKDLYPDVPLIGYFEWFYRSSGSDVGYWEDDKVTLDGMARIRMKNAHHLVNLNACDLGYCPTKWQKSQFPLEYQDKLEVVHEGIDTNFCKPDSAAKLILDDIKLDLSGEEEIITYVSRGFEAYRGFPQFMDALRIVMKHRSKCHAVLIGADKVCYGEQLAKGDSYKSRELTKGGFDMSRVHFVGVRNRADYLKILQNSSVHVYLTRPFVLSWSVLEAMSIGCPLVSSATPPVEEVVVDGENGLLADFRSPEEIAAKMEQILEDRALAKRLSENARTTILERYSVDQMIKKQLAMIHSQLK